MSEDKSQMLIEAGYDLIREVDLPGTRMDIAAVPRLANAFQRGTAAAAFRVRNIG